MTILSNLIGGDTPVPIDNKFIRIFALNKDNYGHMIEEMHVCGGNINLLQLMHMAEVLATAMHRDLIRGKYKKLATKNYGEAII